MQARLESLTTTAEDHHGVPLPVALYEFSDPNNLTRATIGHDLRLSGTNFAVEGFGPGDGASALPRQAYYNLPHDIGPNVEEARLTNGWLLVTE